MIDFSNYGRGKKKYKSSINWGRSLTESSYYSRYSSWADVWRSGESDKEKEELIRRSYIATKDLIVILDFPFRIYIQITKNSQNTEDDSGKGIYGDRRICLPTSIVDYYDDDVDDNKKVNTICGLGLHESAHLMYSDWKVYYRYISTELNPKHELSSQEVDFTTALINLIEDERVEDKLLSERPGLSEFIELAKTHYYSRNITSRFITECEKFLGNLIFLIRFPDLVDKGFVDSHSEIYKKVSNLLNPLPETTKDTCKLGKKIFEIVKEHMEMEFNMETSLSTYIKRAKSSWSGVFTELRYGQDEDSGKHMDGSEVAGEVEDNEMLSKLLIGSAEKGSSDHSYFEKLRGNRNVYMECVSRIRQYIPGIRKIIQGNDKNYDFSIPGCRSGILDTTKLAEAYQGVPQVYIRQGHVRTNKTTLCVLIDESGSMGGTKERTARDAAVLLNESFGSLPGIDLYIYGHSADITKVGDINMTVYREGTKYRPKYALSDVRARVQNRDGEAIFEAAQRVRKYTSARCIMIVISDGDPCAIGYGGDAALKDVKKHVEKVEKMDFEVIQVSIDKVYGVELMFTKYIDLISGLSELPKKLGEVIKKVVVSDKKTIIT